MLPVPQCPMEKEALPALKSCYQKTCIARACDPPDNDWLPDEILMLIMSYFTMKEAARTSLLSHQWKKGWHYFPILTFEDSKAMRRIFLEDEPGQERPDFVRRVNHVVEQHLSSTIDEFRVTFDLDNSDQPQIDEWVIFAFAKQVKRFELDFRPVWHRDDSERYNFSLPFACCKPLQLHHKLANIKPALTSLSLKAVNVTADVLEYFLHFFPFLENLCIKRLDSLTRLRASTSLKHLDISFCWKMKIIDLSAPKLLSFRYEGRHVELHIKNASSLTRVSVSTCHNNGFSINFALDSLSKYFSQLKYLELGINMLVDEQLDDLLLQANLGINPSPALMNLKHLQLFFMASSFQSLLKCTPLFEASPGLEKLALKLWDYGSGSCGRQIKHYKKPLKCLKTLEILGFLGYPHDEELATYVIENAVMLEEVIIDIRHPLNIQEPAPNALKCATKLGEELRRGVKFFIRKP